MIFSRLILIIFILQTGAFADHGLIFISIFHIVILMIWDYVKDQLQETTRFLKNVALQTN